MELEARVAELQNKAQEMAKYYCKGFNNYIGGILLGGRLYLKNPEILHYSEDAYGSFKKIEDFYANIPFDTLYGKEEFNPLFAVKDLLPQFRKAMDGVFKDKSEEPFKNFDDIVGRIHEMGRLYTFNLERIILDIRAIPGQKNFDIQIIDLDGKPWSLVRALLLSI